MKMTIYNTKRKSWTFKPTTRVKMSSKLYNRKRLKPYMVDECYCDAYPICVSEICTLCPVPVDGSAKLYTGLRHKWGLQTPTGIRTLGG